MSDLKQTELCRQNLAKLPNKTVAKIHPLRAEMFYEERQTDGQTDTQTEGQADGREDRYADRHNEVNGCFQNYRERV